jgi:hypothetical protein
MNDSDLGYDLEWDFTPEIVKIDLEIVYSDVVELEEMELELA